MFMTSLGATAPGFEPGELPPGPAQTVQSVRVQVAEIPADVIYAGVTPGFAGLFQVSFTVPDNAPGRDPPVFVEVGEFPDLMVTPPGGFITIVP